MSISNSFIDKIKGDVITPNHPDYASAIARWAKNAERQAQVVVFVKDSQDVVSSLAYAKEKKISIAIRGGGHNVAGASSVEDGLVIDLSKYVNSVRVDSEKKLAYVGGGAVWRDLDSEAIKHGLATVGGTINHTGVGGLTLGGGYGYLSGRHGLTIDNLTQVTVVTADGSVLTASENENADLFWALRGGGCNFGVVTEFVYKLHEQRKTVFAGVVVYTPDKAEKLTEITAKWWQAPNPDEAIMHMATHGPDGSPVIVVVLFFNGSEEGARASFKEFFDIGPILDSTKEIPYEQLNGMQNSHVPHGQCYYLKGVAVNTPDHDTLVEVLKTSTEICKAGNFVAKVLFEYSPAEKVNSVPVSATAFRREHTANVLAILTWKDHTPENTLKAREIAQALLDIVTRGQKNLSLSEKLGYTNYDGAPTSDPTVPHMNTDHVGDKAEAAFGPNYPRLQNIKKKYDPENVFNRWFPIRPAA